MNTYTYEITITKIKVKACNESEAISELNKVLNNAGFDVEPSDIEIMGSNDPELDYESECLTLEERNR